MKIAVTGASGFVGRSVMRQLNEKDGIEAIAVMRANCDYTVENLRGVLRGADAIIHLAGVKGGAGKISDFHVNEVITENLLIAAGEEKIPRIVFASSRLVYSDPALIPWKETQPLDPPNMYGISKVACESLCKLYQKKYGFSYAIVRVAQVLGLGEGTRNMMNVFLENAMQKKELTVMGESVAKRQYIYVEDLATILCRLAVEKQDRSIILNAGMPVSYSNLQIAELINEAFGNPTPIRYDDSFPETIQASEMDVTVLIDEMGFLPRDMKKALEALASSAF